MKTLEFANFAWQFYSDCHRKQKREVAAVLLQGLSDEGSTLYKLTGVQDDVVRDIIWKKMLIKNWNFFPDDQ